jgi:hypothetical protein
MGKKEVSTGSILTAPSAQPLHVCSCCLFPCLHGAQQLQTPRLLPTALWPIPDSWLCLGNLHSQGGGGKKAKGPALDASEEAVAAFGFKVTSSRWPNGAIAASPPSWHVAQTSRSQCCPHYSSTAAGLAVGCCQDASVTQHRWHHRWHDTQPSPWAPAYS